MTIDRTSEFVPGAGYLYAFTVHRGGMVLWSGHGFLTERSRDQAADLAVRELDGRREHPMLRA